MQKAARIESNAVRRVDARLEVSGVEERIEVVSSAVALQTDRADVHITQSSKEVNELPIVGSLGRNYQSLMQVVPGATIVRTEAGNGEANSVAGSPQRAISFSANGVSGWQNQTRIDGSPVQYVWLPTNTAYVPSPEAIEEVSIVTSSYTAEVGMAGGAAVNVVVKSGTNNYRGTGWVYDTNSALRARNVFQTTPDNPKNIVVQYGGNTGGRIVKDKLFFFFNAEKSTQRVAAGSNFRSIAPESLRPNSAGNVVFPMPEQGGAIIYDPLSNPNPALRTPFQNNTIPANRIDPGRAVSDSAPAGNHRSRVRQQRPDHRRDHVRPHQLRPEDQLRQPEAERIRSLRQLTARDRRRLRVGRGGWRLGGGGIGRPGGRSHAGPGAWRHVHLQPHDDAGRQLRVHSPGAGCRSTRHRRERRIGSRTR